MRKVFEKTLESTLVGLLIFVTVCVSLQVFFRYVLNDPLTWSEEAAKLAFMWLVFFGLALAEKDDIHIAVDFFVIRLPNRIQKAVRLAVELFGLAVMLIIGYYAFPFIAMQKAMRSVALDISMMYFSAAIPVGCLLLSIYKIFTISRIKTRDFTAVPAAENAPAVE